MRLRIRTLLLLLLLLTAAPAQPDDSNFRPYIVGGRAAGMGGAFTALADDGSGPYYNPGGLAFVDRSMLSLSASVYGLVKGSQQDALGTGHDLNYSDLDIFPVSTSAVLKYGSTDTPDGAPANALALTVFVPDGLFLDDRDTLAGNQNAVFFSQQEQTIWVGGTYARRLGRLGIGASGFLLIGTSTSFADLTAIVQAANPATFATLTVRTDQTIVGLVGAVGVRYDLTDQLRLGLSFFSPELGIHGERRTFARVAVSDPSVPTTQIEVVNQDGLHATPSLPYRLQAGVAWVSGKLTLAADAVLLGPRETHDDADLATQGFDRRVKRNLVVDGAVGGEYVLGDAFPVRAGFFTDFAASPTPLPKPPGAADPNSSNTTHIDRYGGTFSVGYRTEHTATDVGLIVSYGVGKDLQANNFNFDDLVPTRSTQTLLYVFLASSYRF